MTFHEIDKHTISNEENRNDALYSNIIYTYIKEYFHIDFEQFAQQSLGG